MSNSVPSVGPGTRSVATKTVVKQIQKEARWLEKETERLRVVHARTYLGDQLPLWFLLQLEHECFPLGIRGREEIRYVSVLAATGLIRAEIEALEATKRYSASRRATVLAIAEEGRAEIERIWGTPVPAASPKRRAQGLVLM